MAYKVFTNGSVLQASEVNDNLMKQAVATFSNAAARSAAITSPVAGQVTYLEDVARYDHWNGSSWVSPFGLTLLNKTDFTAQSTVTVSNVFTSTYDRYRAQFSITQNTANGFPAVTLTTGGTSAANNWGYNAWMVFGNGSNGANSSSGVTFANCVLGDTSTNAFGSYWFDVVNPALASRSFIHGQSMVSASPRGSNDSWSYNGVLHNNTTYDGLRITSGAGTFTGTLRIYGYRN